MTEENKPAAYLYTLEYGTVVVNTEVSLHQLNYPFGVCGADYLRESKDGISYVRQTPLYTHPAPVNTALLEFAQWVLSLKTGGMIEGKARAAIAGLRSLKEQEAVEPKCVVIVEVFGKDWRLEYMSLPVGRHKLYPQQFTYTHPAPSVNAQEGGGCTLAGPGRGDCEHSVGIPGKSIPGQHDGPDDTVDAHGKPNGWCWSCWKSQRISELEAENANLRTVMMAAAVEIQEHWDAHCDEEGYGPANLLRRLENGYPEQYGYNAETVVRMERRIAELEAALDAALEAFETDEWMKKMAASKLLREVRRD